MNTTRLIAALALTCATAAYGQQIGTSDVDTSQNAVEQAEPASVTAEPAVLSTEPVARSVEPAAPQLGMDWKRGHNDADARQCLQLTANDQIHRCAEKYRSHIVRAKLSKVSPQDSTKPIEAVKLEPSKSLDLAKTDSQKGADAKAIAKTALPTKN